MGKDYYATLNLTRSATDADIKKSYRTLSLKYHPDKCKERGTEEKFTETAEAYEVLSDEKRRAIYDQYGEEGLKSGVPTAEPGGFTGSYTYHGNPEKTFREFFGSSNPFSQMFDAADPLSSVPPFGGMFGRAKPKQDPTVEKELYLTLEEVYRGCLKKMKISRRVLNDDGHTSSVRDKILTIVVKPGWKEGTRITFPKHGDQEPNNIPADVVFIVKDREHPQFKRTGTDLHYTTKISLVEALTGTTVNVVTLDKRTIAIPINEIVR
jgi:DnaJ family protein B protein 13